MTRNLLTCCYILFLQLNCSAQLANTSKTDEYYTRAAEYANSGNHDSAFTLLTLVADSLKYDALDLLYDADFSSLKTDSRWRNIEASVVSNHRLLCKYKDKSLCRSLDTLLILDSRYRNILDKLITTNADPNVQDSVGALMLKDDKANQAVLSGLMLKHGKQILDVLAKEDVETVFFVIQHAPLSYQLQYYDAVYHAYKTKKLSPAWFALFKDRTELEKGNRQTYGTQVFFHNNKPYVSPLADPANVDKRRASMGLKPMQTLLNTNYNLNWDPTEYNLRLDTIIKIYNSFAEKKIK